ncbi:branched-chain amino acid ABC transporter permease [Isoptericola dokdonensis]|uniref:High-affinity branched-chain amino acid transport system permease protein LivH n=1 Tax=Isoptericola dokdonensis DS-3 TaxID=1300344 RepID=A0A161IIR9_9MICO|nr:branched-chain amino acid ABC transporter permease [Isoptericola dokdonensis]ANC31834.1 High-affinity branched-chain amino acid transport system permease protein LivH [Isoptericola dokdonensis DS-3]
MPNASDTRPTQDVSAGSPAGAATTAAPRRSGTGRVVRLVALVVGAALVLSFPTIAPNPYILSAGVVILSYACTATAWNFMGGFTGYVSLGHAAFFGLGAYATGLLIRDVGLPSFVALLVGALVVLLVTIPVGIAALRVRGASFVIVSISFVLIMLLVFQGWGSFTGGSDGLVVPRPFPDLLRPEHHQVFFYLFAALLAVMLVCWWVIDRSRFGTGLKAVREDEDKAQALGVPTRNYKLVAYVVSATFTGLAGGLYALWFGDLDPIFQFSIMLGTYMVLMALLGGVRNLFGPLLGALIVGTGLEYFKLEFGDTQLHLVATAVLLGVVVLFMPDGIIPAVKSLVQRFGPQDSSIREMTAAELLEHNRAASSASSGATPDAEPAATPTTPTDEEGR